MNKFKEKLKDFRLEFQKAGVFKNSIFVTFSKVFSSITNLVFMIYSVNLMTKAENGSFQYYLGFFPVLLALAEFGLPSAIVKYMAPVTDDKNRVGSILVSSFLLKLYALFIIVLICGIITYLTNENYFVVILLVLGAFFASFGSYFESILVAFRNYLALSIWNPLPNLIRLLLLGIFSIHYDMGYLEILTIYCLSPLFVMSLFFVISIKENIQWSSHWESVIQDQKNLAAFNSWALLASIFAIVSDRMEIFFLKHYHGAEAVAEYGTTLQLFSGFVIILSVLNSLIYPKLSRLVETDEFGSFLWKSILAGGLMAVILLPGIFLGDFIIHILFKTSYSNSVPVYHILYPNFLLQLVFAPLGMALYAMGLPRFLSFLALIRLFFGLVFDNLLIPDFGTKGAAISLFLGQIVSWLILVGYFSAILKTKNEN